MTAPTRPTFLALENFRIGIYAKLFRTSSNTGGKFRIGLGARQQDSTTYWPGTLGYNFSYVEVDATNYAVDAWHFLEFHILVSDISVGSTDFLETAISPVETAPVTGGPLYVSDLYIFEEAVGTDVSQNSQTASYTLQISDAGKHVYITTGGVTVPNVSDVPFNIGTIVSIVNASGSTQTITQGSGVTLRLSGTATTGNRTLAAYGIATLLKVDGNIWNATGNIT